MESYKAKMDEIEADKKEEEDLGPKFPIDHITELDFHDKRLGLHPICLIVSKFYKSC